MSDCLIGTATIDAGLNTISLSHDLQVLLDAENEGRFYIKSADNIGMCSLRIFEYKEIIDAQPAQQCGNSSPVEYATKQELLELKNMINSLTLKYQGGGRNEQSLQPAQFRAKNVSNSNSRE